MKFPAKTKLNKKDGDLLKIGAKKK